MRDGPLLRVLERLFEPEHSGLRLTALALAVGLAGTLEPQVAIAQGLTGVGRRRQTDLTSGGVAPHLGDGLRAFPRACTIAAGIDDEVLSADEGRDFFAVSHALLGRAVVRRVNR